MASKIKNTWLGYIEQLSQQNFSPQQLNIDGIENILSLNYSFHSLFSHSIPMIYLLDYTTGKYLRMSRSTQLILGYECNEWVDNGIGFTIDHYAEDDLKIYNEKIFPDRLQILKKIPVSEQPNYIFTYNLRLKNNKGEFVNLLQRNCYMKSDQNGVPLLSLGVITNIEHYKRENPVIQLVEKINPETLASETFYKKVYYLHDENTIFSKREKEVLLWVTDGLSSKQIAGKLFISEGTVINHRKNMLMKCGAKNVAELISFALLNFII